jgi:hypothetical protein
MLGDDRPRDRKESCSARLARKLCLRTDVEESEVSRNEMMSDTCRLIENVDLAIQNVLGLLVCVLWDVTRGSSLDAIEAGGQVAW